MKDTDYTFGITDVYCDGDKCKMEEQFEGFDGHPMQYSDINQELKDQGWFVGKEDGDWIDLCSQCKEK